MNVFKKASARTYQKILFVGMAFMPWREPELLVGENVLPQTVKVLSSKKKRRVLIVCDKSALSRGSLDAFFAEIKESDVEFSIYDGVMPNPTVAQIEAGLEIYKAEGCDSILAFGGGSAMDCAKIIGARAVLPKKSVSRMKGLLKICKKLPYFIAVPTTAGTGSEATVAAVISDPEKHEKYPINDFSLIPSLAVLDPMLTVGLPPFLTATTGMDALTHAVEAYIGYSNTAKTKRDAVSAVKAVFSYLKRAFDDGKDLEARRKMLEAAYDAGKAFTRAYVGYVHALAHALGGKYGVAHGYANSILLPAVLEAYGKAAHKKLAKLAEAVGIEGVSDGEKAGKFIAEIRKLNVSMGIPEKFQDVFKEDDLDSLVLHAYAEAMPLYPVPREMDKAELKSIYKKVM